MLVGFVVHSLRRGGAERVLLELALGMRSRKIDCFIISLINVNEYRDPRYAGIPTFPLIPAERYHWPWCVPTLARKLNDLLSNMQPDVISISTPSAALVAACSNLRVPAIEMFHGYSDTWANDVCAKARIARRGQRWALKRLDRQAVVVAEPMRKAVEAYLNCPSQRIRVISNGINLDRFRFVERAATPCPIIYTVGTLAEVKQPIAAIQAFKLLSKYLPGARLRVVGDGPLLGTVQELALKSGLRLTVEFLGTRRDVAELLSEGHLLWQLSRSEGIPMACLEAMATGLPVIGTNVRGIQDVVKDGVCGYLVPLGDVTAVSQQSLNLLRNPLTYELFSKAARRRVADHFSFEGMLTRQIEALEDCRLGRWVQ